VVDKGGEAYHPPSQTVEGRREEEEGLTKGVSSNLMLNLDQQEALSKARGRLDAIRGHL
jgi:hypothetical protein